ncbi:DUF6153 family protein [Micromonospora sediminicola]|uniref:DUF6153 family protein n=1 Tax=Micromonospora TaxID=1873 RepID=UPI000BF4CCB7|nr:DUF6153 family protein [Micromonospora sp. WMMA1996]PGH45353.1 hypothetical protein COO58_13660 [Micromonospora sp. WMMA1996]
MRQPRVDRPGAPRPLASSTRRLTRRPARGSHPLLRLALLVAVTLGVFGMHTLGHPAEAGAGALHAGHASTVHASVTAPAADGSPGHHDGMHAFTVCLAVLGGAMVLGALSLLRHRRRISGAPLGLRSRDIRPDRGPPRRPIGLRLRAGTVLRT